MLAPPLKLLGGGPGPPAPPLPTPMVYVHLLESGKDRAAKGKGWARLSYDVPKI